MPKPTSEREIVMVLVVVGHLQKRSAMQAEKADDFELGKTTAGLFGRYFVATGAGWQPYLASTDQCHRQF